MLAEKFAKQNASILKEMGIEWHELISKDGELSKCSCGATGCIASFECHKSNPTFQHPEEVLAVVMKWDDYEEFRNKHFSLMRFFTFVLGDYKTPISIPIDYITIPNKLLEAAVKWRESK